MLSLRRRSARRAAAAAAYDRVVAQARQPEFYTACGVPDTLDGRFELICLHAFLFLHRLKGEGPEAAALGQAFFDAMFGDIDRSLREMGTGDLSVGREVKRMAQSFYGRIQAYEAGLESDDETLGEALRRNVYGTAGETATPSTPIMVAYLRREALALTRQELPALLTGAVSFGPPPSAPATRQAHDPE